MQSYYEAFQAGLDHDVMSQSGQSDSQGVPELEASWDWSPMSRDRSWWHSSHGRWSDEDWEWWQRVRSRWTSEQASGGSWSCRGEDDRGAQLSGKTLSTSDRGQQGSNTSMVSGDAAEMRVPEGFNRHGDLPLGEPYASGTRQSAGGDGPMEGECQEKSKPNGKVSSSYPPIFRAKPGESYREWKRSAEFWLGGEGEQIPAIYRGPRLMVQLRGRRWRQWELSGPKDQGSTSTRLPSKSGLMVDMQSMRRKCYKQSW